MCKAFCKVLQIFLLSNLVVACNAETYGEAVLYETSYFEFKFDFTHNGKEGSIQRVIECKNYKKKLWRLKSGKDRIMRFSRWPGGTDVGVNIDHIFEDRSGLRLFFSAGIVGALCSKKDNFVQEWALRHNLRFTPAIYLVDNIDDPKSSIALDFFNDSFFLSREISFHNSNAFLKPVKFSFKPIGEIVKADLQLGIPLWDNVVGRKNKCNRQILPIHIYDKSEWSKIDPLAIFLEKQKKPLILDPYKYKIVRPLYSFSEAPEDQRWKQRTTDLTSKEVFFKWRGEGDVWRKASDGLLRFEDKKDKKRYYAYLERDGYWRIVKSKNPIAGCVGPQKHDGVDQKEADQKSKYLKVKLGETILDLNDQAFFIKRKYFGLYFFDPHNNFLIRIN